jgi:hypothetical protein
MTDARCRGEDTVKHIKARDILAVRFVAMAAMLSAMIACAPTKVEPVQSYQGTRLPRPEVVVVSDFIAAPEQVKLDTGLGATLRNAASGTSASEQRTEDARKVSAAISKVLAAEIRKLGLPAVQSSEPSAQTAANKLVVGGQILSIDEGNRTRRNLIGLGAGKSDVQARADIHYYAGGASPLEVESFVASAESSRKPGAAETMGVGAATGRVAESAAVGVGTGMAPALSGDVDADGERLAKAIAMQLARFFVSQGWIPAG